MCGICILEIEIFVKQILGPDADHAMPFGQPVTDRAVKVPEIVVTRYCRRACRGVCKFASLINIGALQASAEP